MEGRVRRLGCDASHNRVIPRGTKKVGGKVGPQGEGEGEEGRRVHSPRARVVGSRREVSHGTPARRLFDASDASLAQGRSVSVCVHTPEYACDGEFRVSKSCHVIIIFTHVAGGTIADVFHVIKMLCHVSQYCATSRGTKTECIICVQFWFPSSRNYVVRTCD